MRRLPPLTAVEAFVQVARLGSVKAAAEALALSSPALSRRVQALERFVGRSLFERRHQAMILNTDGETLLARLSPALDALARAVEAGTGEVETLRLRLNVPPLFASQQLMARMPQLREAHPELHIDIDTAPHGLARLGDGLDAAIALAREVDPTLHSQRLRRPRVAVIGAEALLHGPAAISNPRDLARMTIFVHRDLNDLFTVWREAMGVPDLEPAAIDHFDSGHLILDAAAQGLGVAFMLDDHLRGTRLPGLVDLFADTEVASPYSYWFACRRPALSSRAVRIFQDWLIDVLRPA
ncbi:MAG: LysR substrate-binding domain-containing protein [Sphingomonas fennica]